MSHRWTSSLSIAALVLAAGAVLSAPFSGAAAMGAGTLLRSDDTKGKDTLIFRNGRTLVGKIISETPSKIRFKGEINGIALDTEYDKSEILKIVRGTAETADKKDPAGTPAPAPAAAPTTATADPVKPVVADDPSGKKRVYMINLEGRFGRDITETPMRESFKDAQKLNADIVVVCINAEWKVQGQDASDEVSNFDELFRAEKIGPVISDEIELWPKKPQVVVWVKKAMGGAAFLPFYSRDIYFSSEGRMGGVGYLKQMLEGKGDRVFQEKQYSLRLGHARGAANKYGYDYHIIDGMTVTEYVLSAKFEGGQVHYFERMPEGPDEVLLTDDGKDERADTVKQIVAGEGNDVLTLNPKLARDLHVSKGTVDTLDDLLIEMGYSRDWSEIKEAKSKQILTRWRDDFQTALRDLRTRLPQKLSEIQAGGTFQERTKARGQRKRVLQEMQGIWRKFQEVFGEEQALAQISQLNTEIELIDQDQQRDAQESKKR